MTTYVLPERREPNAPTIATRHGSNRPVAAPTAKPSIVARIYGRFRASPWLAVLLFCLFVITLEYIDNLSGGLTLRYSDGRSKLNMARRVWDDLNPGFSQIGGVWLPLPTLLMALTAWFNPFYYSGFSGSFWSMLAFGGTGVFLFLIGRRLTKHWAGSLVPVLLLVANPNVLYLSTTPMAEPMLLCGITASVFFLMRVEERPRDPGRLVQLAPAVLAVTLLRYEGWFLLGAISLLLAFIYARDRQGWGEVQARLIAFLVMAAQGVVLWLIWETLIFHDPLFFSHSKYSAHEIDVVAFGINQNVHNLPGSIYTYWQAMVANAPVQQLLLAVLGLALFVAREARNWRTARVAPLALIAVPLYFILTMYTGQAAIDIAPPGGAHYNIRYGLIAVPLVLTFAGYMAVSLVPRRLKWLPVLGAAAFAITMIPAAYSGQTEILNDRGAIPSTGRLNQIAWLRRNYDGGRFTIEVFKNNDVTFSSHIPQARFITEGNPDLFKVALAEPQRFTRWVYLGHQEDDVVAGALGGTALLDDYYDLAYADSEAEIFRLKPAYDGLQIPDTQIDAYTKKLLKTLPKDRTNGETGTPLYHPALPPPEEPGGSSTNPQNSSGTKNGAGVLPR